MTDGRLFHTVGPWKAKLRWPTDVLVVCYDVVTVVTVSCTIWSADTDSYVYVNVVHLCVYMSYPAASDDRRVRVLYEYATLYNTTVCLI